MATQSDPHERRFLFLQGPHGPFFAALAAKLRATGAQTWRVGVNAGDELLWHGPGYIPYVGAHDAWSDWLTTLIRDKCITDLVLYGATRPIHADALSIARKLGITPHIFEEGYLRPYWITYERGGVNARSPMRNLALDDMTKALDWPHSPVEAPDKWGDLRAHMFWGAVYHWLLLAGRAGYPTFRPHRTPGLGTEIRLHTARLASLPVRAASRRLASLRIHYGGFPYHVVLLQLAHDANFRDNGPFPSQRAFLETVFRGFAEGAPVHHHLVLKAHPLEDGREPLRPMIQELTQTYEVDGRVHFVSGGKLARLLNGARSALTVNSTAAEQVLWRGLPLKAYGQAVYSRPEFVSEQSTEAFFRDPKQPDRDAYHTYRSFLLATSQVPGGYYAVRSRRKLLRQLPDMMLAPKCPTQTVVDANDSVAAAPQYMSVVS